MDCYSKPRPSLSEGEELKKKERARIFIVLVFFLFLVLFFVPRIYAEVEIRYAKASVSVGQGNLGWNRGSKKVLVVQSSISGASRALVKFDLSSIPAGAIIHSAVLYAYTAKVPPISRVYEVHRISNGWSETTTRWNNQPFVALNTSAMARTPTSPSWMSWIVTKDVQIWLNTFQKNHGWMIRDQDENSSISYQTQFHKNSIRLEVDYSAARVEIICGEHITVSQISEEDIDEGYSYFLDRTILRVTSQVNWKVTAEVRPIGESISAGSSEVIEIKNNVSGEWISGGSLIQKGGPTGPDGQRFSVDYRINLVKVGNLNLERAKFEIVYRLEDK